MAARCLFLCLSRVINNEVATSSRSSVGLYNSSTSRIQLVVPFLGQEWSPFRPQAPNSLCTKWGRLHCLSVIASNVDYFKISIVDIVCTINQTACAEFLNVAQRHIWVGSAHPGGYDPQIRTRPRFLYNAPTLKFHHPMFTRSEVIVLTN